MSEIVNTNDASSVQRHELAKTPAGTLLEDLFFSATLTKMAYKETHEDVFDTRTIYADTVRTSVEAFVAEETKKHHVVNQYFIDDHTKVFSFNPHWGTDAQAHVWFHNNVAYVIFKGSATHAIDFSVESAVFPEDIVTWQNVNEDVRPTQPDQVRVHGAIYKQYKSIVAYVLAVLKSHTNAFTSITVTGHSVGGSIATVAAVHLAKEYPDLVVSGHTFAATRVGNSAFNQYVSSRANVRLTRVYTEDDPSVTYPANKEYIHVTGEAICLNNNHTFTVYREDDNARVEYTLRSAYSMYAHGRVAHQLEEYWQRLNKVMHIPNSKLDN